ncbi:MAG TPA: SusC/RagA family TonB-linked outer membrane protein [Gemmatimonadales bacterium]|nr:SusC/RagA family TonB-linked outer membrane protein [Gemmatimonadales bacterium]
MQFTRGRLVPIILSAFLALPALLAAQEPVTITGKVTSDAGQALGQVEVAIPAMGLGGLTRDDGSFTVVIPGARVSGQTVTLVARRLGYKSQSAQVTLASGGVTHDFVLAANPLQLGEVVVTGAGTSAAANALGSVRNNVAADQIDKASETNIVEALAAKAPNVNVLQQSGDPGAGSFINIRGISTLMGNNQPLFVIDGVPTDNSTYSTSNFNAPDDGGGTLAQFGQTEGTVSTNRAADINPSDIESVEILKGPSASAIYGSRAAAGVVLITTKSGRSGPTHFTFRSSTSFNDINHTYPLQTTFGLGTQGVHADTSLGGQCDVPGAGICGRSWGPAIPAGAAVFDHANDIYRIGHTLDNGFSVSGGNDRTTFYLSGDYNHDQGVFVGPNNWFERATVRFKGSHRVIDNVKLGADLSFADSRASYIQRGNNTNGIQLGDLRTPPDFNNLPYVVQTNAGPQQRAYRFEHPNDGSLLDDRTFDNPYWTAFMQENTAAVGRVYGNVNAEYLPVAWLKVNYTLGADYWTDERLEGCPVSSASPCTDGRVIEGKIVNYSIDHNLTATANYNINPDLGGTITLGQNLDTRNTRSLGTVGRTLVALQPFKLSNTVTQDIPIDQEFVIHDASWFGQAGLDVKSQLHLIAALRNDGSSTFGVSNLRSWFPKGSVAWEFTKAIGEQSWLSYGKARVAYGEAGQEPQPYLTSQTFTSGIVGGISQGTGNTPTQNGLGGLVTRSELRPASVLKPERSKEFEAGVDLGFFKDKADASITYYNKKSSDIILLQPLNPSGGFFQQGANAATMRNRGWEVSFNVRPLQKSEYGWEVGLQWARNRNTVLSLGGEQFISIGDFNNQVAMVGQPIGVYLGTGFVRCGISPDGTPVTGTTATDTTLGQVCATAKAPKGALYIGPNGYPIGDQVPRVVQDPNYNWTGSVRSSFRFRKLQVSGLLDIRNGGQIWNGPKGALWSYGTRADTDPRAACTNRNNPASCTGNAKTFGSGGWFDGPVAGPGAGTAVGIGEYWYRNVAACPFVGIDEPCIEDAGFVKLREVSVSYTLDAPWVQRSLGFSSIDLRVSGRNLKTWTNYTGYDPETNLGGSISGNAGAGGVDYFNNPQTRSFVFSVTLNH